MQRAPGEGNGNRIGDPVRTGMGVVCHGALYLPNIAVAIKLSNRFKTVDIKS
jgi:hypothetical protein